MAAPRKTPRKTPTLQGSVNIICRAAEDPAFSEGVVVMLVAFVAEQFGRTLDDILWRVEATLERGFHRQ